MTFDHQIVIYIESVIDVLWWQQQQQQTKIIRLNHNLDFDYV